MLLEDGLHLRNIKINLIFRSVCTIFAANLVYRLKYVFYIDETA